MKQPRLLQKNFSQCLLTDSTSKLGRNGNRPNANDGMKVLQMQNAARLAIAQSSAQLEIGSGLAGAIPRFLSQPDANRSLTGDVTRHYHSKPFFENRTRNALQKFSRKTLKPEPFYVNSWHPDSLKRQPDTSVLSTEQRDFAVRRRLSAIARYVFEILNKHKNWNREVIQELEKLHRVTANVATEVLKVLDNAELASKFFHWAMRQKRFRNNFSVYNAYVFCLNRCNKYKDADQVLELMRTHGKEPTLKQFEILIKMHAQARRGARVFFIYQKMRKFGCKPNVFLYNRILDSLIKTEELNLALRVFEGMKADAIAPDGLTYMILIRGLCKEGEVDRAFQLMAQMREKVCRPDVFAYTSIIKMLVSSKNLIGAWRFWREMDRDGVNADVKAYNTMIMGLCEINAEQKARSLFQEMKERGILVERMVYASLVSMYARNGKVNVAYDLLKDMTECGYRAHLEIYDSLIEGFCNKGEIDQAYKLLQALMGEKISPQFSTTRPFLSAFAEKSDMDGFHKFLKEVSAKGREVKQDLSDFLSSMALEDGRVAKAVEVFESLKGMGYYSVSIFNVLIDGLQKSGDQDRGFEYFKEMETLGCMPNAQTYNSIILCLLESGNTDDACHYFCRMKERSWVPTISVYDGLVRSLCKIGEINAALSLVRDCLGSITNGPQDFKHSLTVFHACKSGNAEDVLKVLTEIMQQGIALEGIICCTVIGGLCKHGNSEEVRKVFSTLRRRNLISASEAASYDALMIEYLTNTTAETLYHGLKFFGLESLLTPKNIKVA